MIFMNNETGELYEMLICSLDTSNPEADDSVKKWRLGAIALFGAVDPEIRHSNEIIEKMTLVGFI